MIQVNDFPDVRFATEDGLLALGGDLSAERLLSAYRKGIFPWYNPGEPVLWWTPDPRCVIFPASYKPSRSLRKAIRSRQFVFTVDHAFNNVIKRCAAPRAKASGTWITPEMIHAYKELHRLGHAHSVETWRSGELVGGLYGVALGQVFFGESMFSSVSDASKAALDHLINRLLDWRYTLIDCQITSSHLLNLGAQEIPRGKFIEHLENALAREPAQSSWARTGIQP